MAVKKDFLIEKRNVLNEIRANNMTLQELRFFSIYLAKINSRDIDSRIVRFTLAEFQKIMELGSRVKIDYLKHITDGLLCKVVRIPTQKGGYDSFQLFKRCKVDLDDNNQWFVEIDAHDQSLPLMFEFKDRYFTYELWNALRLKSSNQLRMYEILKQYEKLGERIISVEELKELLGIDKNEYERFGNFKVWVLDVSQRALAENTDIKFSYDSTGKRGKGGKIINLKFIIQKNTHYIDQLTLSEFIGQQDIEEVMEEFENESQLKSDNLTFLAESCGNEFSESEVQVLYNLIIKIMPYVTDHTKLEWYDYLKRKYDELNWRAGRTKILSRFGYLKKLIEADSI